MTLEGQNPTDDQAQAGQVPADANMQEDGQGSGTPEPKTFDESYVKKLRDEAAANRKKAADLQAQIDEAKKAEMSEIERAKADAQQAQETAKSIEAKYRQAQRDMAITQEAAKAGFPVAAALKLADVTVSDDGAVSGVEEAIKQLVADYPGMVAGAGGGSNGSSMNGSRAKKKQLLTKAEIESKSPQWRNENWALVQESLANL